MDYIESNLVPGETVLYRTRLHWIVLIWPVVAGLLLGSAGFVFVVGGYEASGKGSSYAGMIIVGLLLLIGAAALIGLGLSRKNSTEVAVSNKRVLIKSGFINRKSIEVLLPKIESIGVDESGLGRMLGYGSVIVRALAGRSRLSAGLRIRTNLGDKSSNKSALRLRINDCQSSYFRFDRFK